MSDRMFHKEKQNKLVNDVKEYWKKVQNAVESVQETLGQIPSTLLGQLGLGPKELAKVPVPASPSPDDSIEQKYL